jgi:hypothetical protein
MHTTKVVDKKKLSNGEIAVLIQCCEDPTEQSWHTLSFTKDTAAADVTAWLADRHAHVQDSHATAQAIDAQLSVL